MNETATNAESAALPVDYVAFQQRPQFQDLRKRQRSFVFPLAVFFLLWYFAYVLVAAFFPSFLATPLIGNINVGIVLGLLQFLTTFGITMWYVSFANNKLDPESAALRAQLEQLEGTADHPAHDPARDGQETRA